MSIKKTLGRVGIVLSVAVTVGLIGCTDEGNPGGNGNSTYNNSPVTINGLTWTKNLNIETPNSKCYDDNPAYCAKYGRHYKWEAAKSACASMGGGWRLPDTADWNNLINYAGGRDVAGKKLKSKSGWQDDGNGTDDYGFSALPGGFSGYLFDNSQNVVSAGYWWSSTSCGDCSTINNSYGSAMFYNRDEVSVAVNSSDEWQSVRCVANN